MKKFEDANQNYFYDHNMHTIKVLCDHTTHTHMSDQASLNNFIEYYLFEYIKRIILSKMYYLFNFSCVCIIR